MLFAFTTFVWWNKLATTENGWYLIILGPHNKLENANIDIAFCQWIHFGFEDGCVVQINFCLKSEHFA